MMQLKGWVWASGSECSLPLAPVLDLQVSWIRQVSSAQVQKNQQLMLQSHFDPFELASL